MQIKKAIRLEELWVWAVTILLAIDRNQISREMLQIGPRISKEMSLFSHNLSTCKGLWQV